MSIINYIDSLEVCQMSNLQSQFQLHQHNYRNEIQSGIKTNNHLLKDWNTISTTHIPLKLPNIMWFVGQAIIIQQFVERSNHYIFKWSTVAQH